MCGAPKPGKVEKTPVRAATLFPNNGDASVRATDRGSRRLSMASMIFANKGGTLGAPTTTSTLGV